MNCCWRSCSVDRSRAIAIGNSIGQRGCRDRIIIVIAIIVEEGAIVVMMGG